MKISKIWKKTENRILIICLIMFALFGLSSADLGAVSFFSLWALARFIPTYFLFVFFFDAVEAFSYASIKNKKRKMYKYCRRFL